MSLVSFPPRDAGPVLARALAKAEAAGAHEAAQRRATDSPCLVEQAALDAAMPDLRLLTSDPVMVGVLAHAMASEVMIRLRKRGLA